MGMNQKGSKGTFSDINVTPLVDVMLVLLVIFMITTPLMLNGIKLNLPKTREVNPINLTTTQVVLSLTKTGEYFIGKNKVLENEIVGEIKNLFKENKTETLFLRADFAIEYGKVAKIMSYLKIKMMSKIDTILYLMRHNIDIRETMSMFYLIRTFLSKFRKSCPFSNRFWNYLLIFINIGNKQHLEFVL